MGRDKVRTIRLGTDYMNDEQLRRFYEVSNKHIKEHEQRLEELEVERLRAMQKALYICRNYYRLGLDRKK